MGVVRLKAGTTFAESSPPQVAGYPTRPIALEIGHLQPQLLVVTRLEEYVDAERLLRDADAPEPPYWAHLWPASRSLARLMATLDCAGRRVVEIGCGLGLAGIVAAMRGAAVTMTDTAHAALCFARANAHLNHCGIAAIQTDLRRPGTRGHFDYCLAADVTYEPTLQNAVAEYVAQHLAAGGRAWCAESVRTFDRGLADACQRNGLQATEQVVHEPDEGRPVPVRITEIAWEAGSGS